MTSLSEQATAAAATSSVVWNNNNNNDTNNYSQTHHHPTPPFEIHQKVLAKDINNTNDDNNETFYPAVIRQTKINANNNHWSFLVHYLGWNSRWDQWMSPEHLKEVVPEADNADDADVNVDDDSPQKQRSSLPMRPLLRTKRTKAVSRRSNNSSSKRRKAAPATTTSASTSLLLYQDYCELPFTLKAVLVEEWETIVLRNNNHQNQNPDSNAAAPPQQQPQRLVHALPAKVSIRTVLDKFVQSKNSSSNQSTAAESQQQQVQEFATGLMHLLETALPNMLLYPQERPQYETTVQTLLLMNNDNDSNDDQTTTTKKKNKSLVDIYGCEYLLRLYVHLPVLLQAEQNNNNNSKNLKCFGPLLSELMVLLQKNKQTLFSSNNNNNNNNTSNYRPVQPPHEWMDWEKRLYGGSK